MFVLTPHITIGSVGFTACHEVRVTKSIHSFVDMAEIRLPASCRLRKDGELQTQSVQAAKQFQEGDKVTIKLGYDDKLETEFEGFVKRVDFSTPCVIECEGYSYQLRKTAHVKDWKDAKVKDILQHITSGTDITLSSDIPDIKFEGNFYLNDEDGTQCLDKLKKGMSLTVYFIGKTLYVGLEQTAQLDKEVKYRLGWNVIKDDNLKYRRNEDAIVRVRVTYKGKKGESKHKIFGKTGGVEQVMELGVITDDNLLKQMVNAEARKYRYAGYEGKITTFLVPFSQPGWKAVVEDQAFAERNGSYLIVSTDVSFGTNGARRVVELGKSLSKQHDELTES